MKKANYILLFFLVTLSSCYGQKPRYSTDPKVKMLDYKGQYNAINGEGVELILSIGEYSSRATLLYRSLYNGGDKGWKPDIAIGSYLINDLSISIIVADTLYISGAYSSDKTFIEASWTGSLGHMWDTCAVRYSWPQTMRLELLTE
ncbi:MAG: hypothetical protein IJK44_10385 [Bacteroidales bacterium]|nr:hypothetical protein [Bacteroidales bacterium]